MVAFKGRFDGKVIVPDEPIDLPVGARVDVHVQPQSDGPAPGQSVVEWILENPLDDPSLPTDGGAEHDHYLHGTPKKYSK